MLVIRGIESCNDGGLELNLMALAGRGLENGMRLRQAQPPSPESSLSLSKGIEGTFFIEESGRQKEAEYGIKILAQEIMAWQKEKSIKALNIFLPSGTGTTALLFQKSLFTLHSSIYLRLCGR